VQKYPSGVISVDVHGKPMFWLFDEYELSEWLRDKLEELENDNKDE
jgi:phage terminase Nu1 subunit (DNA packaging protein)